MTPNQLIKEIESKYDIENISSNNLPIWQYIRNLLYHQTSFIDNQLFINRIKDFYYLMKNYGWGNLSKTKPYEYVLFTDSDEQKLYNNQLIDKTAQNLIELVQDKLLIVENPHRKLHNSGVQYNADHMSSSFFHYSRWKLGLINSLPIENKNILNTCFQKYNLELNVNYYNQLFFTYVKIFTDWLNIVAPKAVFINCYYSLFHQALIYVCKKNKIKTIEMQHGLISQAHIQYAPQKFIGTDTFPDYILTYGNYVKNIINSNFIAPENILPIGHYYLEEILNDKLILDKNLQKYNKTIVVSTQKDVEHKLLERIDRIASKKPNIEFLIKCRSYKKILFKMKNVKIEKNNDIYKLIKNADLHISCYSTVALEASMLGTPSILININNMANLYYKSLCEKFTNIKICESDTEIIDLIDNWVVSNDFDKPYAINNKHNIKQFLNDYINNENSVHIS